MNKNSDMFIMIVMQILFIRFIAGYLALWCVYPHRLVVTDKKQEWYFAAAGLCGIMLISFGGKAALHLNPLGDILAINAAVIWLPIPQLPEKLAGLAIIRFKQPGILFSMV